MSDGNKNQRHQFLNYLEDYQEIAKSRDEQSREEQSWLDESQDLHLHKQRFVGWVYALSAIFLLVVIGFWWNISRAQFYQALDKPLSDNKFQEFLWLMGEVKNPASETNFDWRVQLNDIDESTLSEDEKQALTELKEKVNSGAGLGEIINDLK